MHRSVFLFVACLALFPIRCPAGEAIPGRDPRRFPADLRALRALRDEFAGAANDGSDAFLRRFWADSGRVARARGPAILHALMGDSHRWHDEEILAYHSMILQLDRRSTLRVFAAYERAYPSSKPFFDDLRYEMTSFDDARRQARRKRG